MYIFCPLSKFAVSNSPVRGIEHVDVFLGETEDHKVENTQGTCSTEQHQTVYSIKNNNNELIHNRVYSINRCISNHKVYQGVRDGGSY